MLWNNWKNITPLERAAIQVVKSAQEVILKTIPKKEIVSIYLGGTFLRREMMPNSDVDLWVITKTITGQKRVTKLIKNVQGKFKPPLGLSGYSVWELKRGKWLKYLCNKPRTAPQRFAKKLHNYKLIYGKKLDPADFAIRTDREDLNIIIATFHDQFIPDYQKGTLDFQSILKQTFWLADLELCIKSYHPPHSWAKMVELTPKDHIARTAFLFRTHEPTKHEQTVFMKKLSAYLAYLKGAAK